MKIKCKCFYCQSKEDKRNKLLRIKWFDKPENCISLEISDEKGKFIFPQIIIELKDLKKIVEEFKK